MSEALTGKSAVVTSWARNDGTFHNPTHPGKRPLAIDFRTRDYTDDELISLLECATSAGLPCVSLYRGEDRQHIHCGDIATLAYEVE